MPPSSFSESKPREFYENLYQNNPEPWNYKNRAVEVLRHDAIVGVLKSLRGRYPVALDIGCSLGQLTEKLRDIGGSVCAFDVSLTAVQKARSRCAGQGSFHFLLSRLPGIPLQKGRLDLVVASDCIHEFVPEDERESAIREIGDLLNKEGLALFCDYMRPGLEERYCALIRQSGLKIVRIERMYDRVWYQFESWFKAVRNVPPIKKILNALWLAKILRYPAMLLGKYGSTHVLIVASRP